MTAFSRFSTAVFWICLAAPGGVFFPIDITCTIYACGILYAKLARDVVHSLACRLCDLVTGCSGFLRQPDKGCIGSPAVGSPPVRGEARKEG